MLSLVRRRGGGDSLPGIEEGPQHQLVVGRHLEQLNTDRSSVFANPKADPTPTLSMEEIAAAPAALKTELMRRYVHFMSVTSGASTNASPLAEPFKATAGNILVKATPEGEAVFTDKSGRMLRVQLDGTVEMQPPDANPLQMMLEAFERLLLWKGSITEIRCEKDPQALALFDLLLGPSGVFNPDNTLKLQAGERYANTKIHFWDYNGTVERYSRPVEFRPGMAEVADNMIRMGAINALTTSVPPEIPGRLMDESGIKFNAHFGRDEVRPDKGNKVYRGLAQLHGIPASELKDRVLIVGDSTTDAPKAGDLPGVLFVYSFADTPAEAIQLLTHGLDKLGEGSYADGLDKLAPKLSREPQLVRLGAIEFEVFQPRRDENFTGDGPVIMKLRLGSSDAEIATRLATRPAPEQQGELSEYQLTMRTIREGLAEDRLLPLIEGMASFADPEQVLAQLGYRQSVRRAEEHQARQNADELTQGVGGAASADEVIKSAKRIARAGDLEAARSLVELSNQYSTLTDTGKEKTIAKHERFAGALATLIDETLGATGGKRPVDMLVARTLKFGLSGPGYDVYEAIEKLKGCDAEEVKALLDPIKAQIPKWKEGRLDSIDHHFAQRQSIAKDVKTLAAQATTIAARRSETWQKVDDALAALK